MIVNVFLNSISKFKKNGQTGWVGVDYSLEQIKKSEPCVKSKTLKSEIVTTALFSFIGKGVDCKCDLNIFFYKLFLIFIYTLGITM